MVLVVAPVVFPAAKRTWLSTINGACGLGTDGTASPGALGTVDSVYGSCAFQGFFPTMSGEKILNGASATLSPISLESCSSFCAGAPYFAVDGKLQLGF